MRCTLIAGSYRRVISFPKWSHANLDLHLRQRSPTAYPHVQCADRLDECVRTISSDGWRVVATAITRHLSHLHGHRGVQSVRGGPRAPSALDARRDVDQIRVYPPIALAVPLMKEDS